MAAEISFVSLSYGAHSSLSYRRDKQGKAPGRPINALTTEEMGHCQGARTSREEPGFPTCDARVTVVKKTRARQKLQQ